MHAGAQVRELLEGLKTLAGFSGQSTQRGRHQIAEGLAVGTPDPAPQLVQVAQPKLVRLVDQDGVGVRDVDAAFDDRCGDEYVVRAIDETSHDVFEFLALHLAMSNPDSYVGAQALNHARHFLDVAHAVVHEVRLSATADFVGDRVTDDFFVEAADDGVHRMPVGRWGTDDAEVAGAHQGELQRPWNGGRGKCECIHVGLEGLQLVLHADAKLLFFVDDEQPQVLELDALSHDGVGANQHVDLSVFELLDGFRQRLARLESVDVIDRHGEFLKATAEALVVLHGQDGRRDQHRHLLAVASRPEGRSDGNFGLAKPDVSADQAVHGG